MLARRYDIGLNIDAEEADRLELSLDLLESLSLDPELRTALHGETAADALTPRAAVAWLAHNLITDAGATFQLSEPEPTTIIFGVSGLQ